MSFDLGELVGDVRGFAEKALDDPDAYKEALEKGLKGVGKAQDLLSKIQGGNREAVETALTEWDDVNQTLSAIGKMDKAIEDAENGIELNDVLDVAGKVLKVVVTLGAVII